MDIVLSKHTYTPSFITSAVSTLGEWKKELLYGILLLFGAYFVITPICHLTEDRIKIGATFVSAIELHERTDTLARMLNAPLDTADIDKQHTQILDAYADIDAQCYALQVTQGGTRQGYAMTDHTYPCFRIWGGDLHAKLNDHTFQYIDATRERDTVEAAGNHGVPYPLPRHPEIDSKRDLIIDTVWHPEKLLEAHTNGMVLCLIWFLVRLREKGWNIAWEVWSGHLFIMVCGWELVLWYYPGNPYEQWKKIKQWCGYILSALVSCIGGGVKADTARTIHLSGGITTQSSFVLDNAKTFEPGPVIQPWLEAQIHKGVYGASYIGVWSSFGFEHASGNEIDFSAGYRTVVNGVSLDASYNYYRFLGIGEGMHAPQIVSCIREVCAKVKYLVPDTGASEGCQFGAFWRHDWTHYFSTNVGIFHTRGVYGRAPVTVLKGEIAIPINRSVSVFARGYAPVAGGQADNSEPIGLIGVRVAW